MAPKSKSHNARYEIRPPKKEIYPLHSLNLTGVHNLELAITISKYGRKKTE